MLVLTNQVAYWVVTRLSTLTGQHAVEQGVAGGAGYTAYSNAYQLWVVPQGIITVSARHRADAADERAAADGRPRRGASRRLLRAADDAPPSSCPPPVRCSRSRRG